jgi:hypothetical protein
MQASVVTTSGMEITPAITPGGGALGGVVLPIIQ